ncbi:MmpS family transport accessory protein, partial [Mycolicibacter kumamotonensis]
KRQSYITGSGELAVATVTLPWSLDIEMSSPMRPASVTATTLGGGALTCRLEVDGAEQDARESEPGAGVVLCSVVSA